ncbi:hypothetical protein MMC22_007917 [Lobaria immixta]|nr:hypothetical protein [Lobaria immixta]
MDPQIADSGYSGDDIAMTNSPLTAVSHVPVTTSPAAVFHTDARYVTNPITSFVPEPIFKRYHSPSESSSRPENPHSITDSDNLEKWKQAQRDLESEKKQHNLAKVDLKEREQELNYLRRQAEVDQELNELLLKKDQELYDLRKRWRQASSELNKYLSDDQRFYQVTDQEFIEKTTQLRFNIRNFADQQFGVETIDAKGFRSFWKIIQEYFRISYDSFEACMKDPLRRPMIVGAFLWAVLKNFVFGEFCWAETSVSSAMSRLGQVLEPVGDDTLSSGLEAKRKFQMWRANTTGLLLDAKKLDPRDDHGAHQGLHEKVEGICQSLRPFSKSKDHELIDQLFRIINEALNLDTLISKQVAEIIWDSDLQRSSEQFDQDSMELWRGEKQTDDSENVWLVSVPGMIKRGKSTGKDFNVEYILLKMEVAWEPENHRKDIIKSSDTFLGH